jgi:hypothetical protein
MFLVSYGFVLSLIFVKGILMDVYGSEIPRRVYNTISMLTCDFPASQKARGHAGHSHKTQACDQCEATTEEFHLPRGYDIDSKFLNFLSMAE